MEGWWYSRICIFVQAINIVFNMLFDDIWCIYDPHHGNYLVYQKFILPLYEVSFRKLKYHLKCLILKYSRTLTPNNWTISLQYYKTYTFKILTRIFIIFYLLYSYMRQSRENKRVKISLFQTGKKSGQINLSNLCIKFHCPVWKIIRTFHSPRSRLQF